MIRFIAITGSITISFASLRVWLGLPAFGSLLEMPNWASLAGAILWFIAAAAAVFSKD